MKIKLAILEKDANYLNRIVTVFSTKYADKFEIYSFTDPTVALSSLDNIRIDVLVASDAFDIDVENLPKRCGFAYFVESADIHMENDQRAICKFQKADLIYKQILSVYSEKAGSLSGLKLDDNSAKICVFNSVSGGTGASTMAAAAAMHFASQNKKTLYLNLEKFGSADTFFTGEGQFGMSDVIYALKSRKANLSLKLESCVKQGQKGVNFYSQSQIALDMLELNFEDIEKLISELKITGSYDYIVIDTDFSLDKESIKICKLAHSVVWVGDGSEISNNKILRAFNALSTIESNADMPLTSRICLLYNKFSNKSGAAIGDIGVKNAGGAPRFEHATTAQILEQLYTNDMFDKIF